MEGVLRREGSWCSHAPEEPTIIFLPGGGRQHKDAPQEYESSRHKHDQVENRGHSHHERSNKSTILISDIATRFEELEDGSDVDPFPPIEAGEISGLDVDTMELIGSDPGSDEPTGAEADSDGESSG